MSGPVLLPFDPLAPLAERALVLEASAGTGKTYSIASLFVRLVVEEEALEPREVLLVTFTEAATAELRERIRARLRDTQEALSAAMRTGSPPDGGDRIAALLAADGIDANDLPRRVRRIRRALECFDEITLSTIHGFCRRMLQQNAFESGADFDTELVADLSGVVADAVTDFLAEETYGLPPEALDWIDAAGGRERLSELASKVVRDPDLAVLPLLGPDPVAWEGFETAVAKLREAWDTDGGGLGALAAVLDAGARKCFARNRFRAGWFSGWHAAADAWIAAGCPLSCVPEHLQRLSASDLVAACERGAAPSHPVFDRVQDVIDRAEGARRHVAGWRARMHRALADRVRRRVEEHKRLHHATTFDDLLRDLRDALEGDRGDSLRAAIARLYRVALIDEFQDTDPVQWGVFRRVFSRPDSRMYLIGDPKQAIYGFRRADIETYLAARAEVGQGRTLDANWRSDGPLVHALNRLYEACPAPFLREDIACPPVRAGLGDPVVRIRFPATGGWAPLRVAVVGRTRPAQDALPSTKDAKPLSREAATERAVAFTASDVAAFLAGAEIRDADLLRERPETGGWRRARPGDTAVLVRYNWQGEAVQRALRAAGIPGVRAGHDDVMASDEARDLARALAAVLSPDDRRAVRTGLATPLFGNTAADLDALDADQASADAPRDVLAALAEEWRDAGFMAMFRRLLHDRGVAARLLAWKDGERCMTNLLHAAELLHAEESGGGRGPLSLLQWLREQTADPGGGDAETRLLRLESDADAVQIVTIHSCKGLQYKAVWCPFLWDGRLLSKRDAALPRFHRDGGMAVDTVAGGPDFATHLAAAEREAFEENLRLAYVAMTRAERVCTVVTGRISGVETSPLGVLLHWKGDPADASDLGAIRSAVSALSADDLRAQVASLAAASIAPGTGLPSVTLVDVPADDPTAAVATARPSLPPGSAPLAVREWTGRAFDRAWRRTSFSGMIRGGQELPDPDAEFEPPAIDEGDPGEAGGAVDESGGAGGDGGALLADAPGGAAIGNALHEVLERIDFEASDPRRIREEVATRLRLHGVDAPVDEVADALVRGLGTPLPRIPGDGAGRPGLRLRDIRAADRLSEMAFDFPVAGGLDAGAGPGTVTPADVAAVFEDHPDGQTPTGYSAHLRRLRFGAFRGYLNGKVDLVFRVRGPDLPEAGRYYVVDYKSNRLGDRLSDYAPPRLAEEVADAHYVLQYHLYLVALHRLLAWRLGEAYDYDSHVGGAYYLFLRGLGGEAAVADTGVFRHRPSAARIEALSALFDAGGRPRWAT